MSVERFDPPPWRGLGGAEAVAAKPSEGACDEDSESDEEDDAEPCARSAPALWILHAPHFAKRAALVAPRASEPLAQLS